MHFYSDYHKNINMTEIYAINQPNQLYIYFLYFVNLQELEKKCYFIYNNFL